MKHSIFWKIFIGLLVVIMLAEAIMMFFLYNSTYDAAVEDATDHIQYAATSAANAFQWLDPDNPDDLEGGQSFLNNLCSGLNITYLYVVKPDVESKSETYILKGWGDNASNEFVNNRYSGYVAKGGLKDEQIRALNGEEKVMLHDKNQYDDTLICYTPVKKYYSSQTHEMKDDIQMIVCAEVSLSSVMNDFNHRYINFVFIIVIVTVLILLLTGLILYFRISKPLKLISGRMKSFVSRNGEFFEKLPVKGKDEIAKMSESFNTMAEEIDHFIMKLSELNRQKAELQIASNIQMGLLEPQQYRNETVCVKASMLPAKEVGGDLYDYRVLENGNIFFTVADVSGKGISAALFMSRAITLLRQYAELGYSPGKILFEYNNHLAGHNPNRMFITTFAAVYHPETGVLTYANAGHNKPYVLSDRLIKLDGKHGAAAGVFKNTQYPETTISLNAGDRVYLYTDGVTEAQNTKGEFLGDETLERVLHKHLSSDAEELSTAVLDEIKSFTNGAVQTDDITVLTLQILRNNNR